MSDHLNEMEKESLDVIRNAFKEYSRCKFYAMTSTGKDSMVTIHLVHKVNPDVPVIFHNTSLDCADTYRMAKQHSEWITTNPKEGFYNWSIRNNFIPQRMSRACCTVFKEGEGDKYFEGLNVEHLVIFMGVRNSESAARADREYITHNPKWNNKDWYGCLPIRKWSDLDIWLYIIKNDIEVNNKYKKGYHRVGCAIACCFATKYTWVLDKYWYPKMRERWEAFLHKDFVQGLRWNKLNCTENEYVMNGWNGGLYRPEPTDEVIEEFMNHKQLTDRNVALQYFNKTCADCGKNVRQSDVLAMNLKLQGRNTNQIFCKKHLMERLNINKEQWNENIESFKAQGCTLF